MSESLFTDAGWFFFAAWSVVVGWVSVAAFGRDLLPAEVHADSEPRTRAADAMAPTPNAR